jgi:hypothetical protein
VTVDPRILGPSRPVREGESRTAGMYVLELLNKEGQPLAEAVEERAWPEKNIARSNTFPTQGGKKRVPGAVCGEQFAANI